MSSFVLLFTPFYAICPPFQEAPSGNPNPGQNSPTTSLTNSTPSRSRPWHDFGRQNDVDKVQIPKM
jgi:hypothetical protein